MPKPARPKKSPAFSFVLDELNDSPLAGRIRTRPMFGSHAVYVDQKIVFILRQRNHPKTIRDNGIWVAMLPEFTESVRKDFPTLRPIELFAARSRTGFTGWLNLPDTDDAFEESALALCRLLIRGDKRLGKIPKSRAPRRKSKVRMRK
ncbi:MAG TPA: hypothetical protein VN025_17285 [Candidatus Dormibacteraeota bacterium]|jgi:hypothetical protein|nr:hypothetical protein [Candidatus Dormibacteraeota bacterium]